MILAAGDTLGLDVVMTTEANLGSEVYSTSFDSGDDMGWTFTGGTNPFELSAGFCCYPAHGQRWVRDAGG